MALVVCTYRRPESVRTLLQSAASQSRPIDQVIVVDASPDRDTELVVSSMTGLRNLWYWRVETPLKGLTRQRNFALQSVDFDLVAFFDDDVVLDRGCVEAMERAHRDGASVAGVGCFAEAPMAPTTLWRLRRLLRMVPDLRPGTYTRTGMSVPWRFHAPTDAVVEGDWLPGCAMMLDSVIASQIGFDEVLVGYAQGEDLDFSLRLRERGRILVAGAARCQHLHAPAGRPDAFKLGRMEICNRHRIWRRVYRRPRVFDRLGFAYAWTLDTLLLARDAVRPRYARDGLLRIAGRVIGASYVLRNRPLA